MNASEMGSNDWWKVVESMPFDEAIQSLNSYKSSLLEATAGTSQYQAGAAKLHRVNAQIKRINVIRHNDSWMHACKAVLPPEVYQAVHTERARLNWTDQ